MSDRYYEDIYELLKTKGELGVSVIAKEIGAPPSSLQRYLERQTYFKKTARAKWDLPERVTEEFTETVEDKKVGFLVNALETQAVLVSAQIDALQTQMHSLVSQATAIKPLVESYKPPVASKAKGIDPRLSIFVEEIQQLEKALVLHKDRIPENYNKLLKGVNWLEMALNKGLLYMREVIGPAIAGLITDQTEITDTEIYSTIEKYKS